jgi:branched-chain amino acid transport system permease protein
MILFQYLSNGLILGGLYACIAAGFSLVWGVLSIINLLHGSFIVLGYYIAFFSYTVLGIHPFVSVITSGIVLGALGYVVQLGLINRVVAQSVLVTLILTFGLDLIMNNAMLVAFSANIFIPLDRAVSTLIAFLLILALWLCLRLTSIGRAIVAVRFDREAALLMGIDVKRTYAITFALGGAMAGAAGSLLSVSFPISPLSGPLFLSKAFVICILGGVGSVPGAALGGLIFGMLESFGAVFFGSEYALTLSFVVLIVLLLVRPHGLLGVKGF